MNWPKFEYEPWGQGLQTATSKNDLSQEPICRQSRQWTRCPNTEKIPVVVSRRTRAHGNQSQNPNSPREFEDKRWSSLIQNFTILPRRKKGVTCVCKGHWPEKFVHGAKLGHRASILSKLPRLRLQSKCPWTLWKECTTVSPQAGRVDKSLVVMRIIQVIPANVRWSPFEVAVNWSLATGGSARFAIAAILPHVLLSPVDGHLVSEGRVAVVKRVADT